MKLTRKALILATALLIGGCANQVKVSVDRVIYEGSTKLKEESNYGIRVRKTVLQLRSFRQQFRPIIDKMHGELTKAQTEADDAVSAINRKSNAIDSAKQTIVANESERMRQIEKLSKASAESDKHNASIERITEELEALKAELKKDPMSADLKSQQDDLESKLKAKKTLLSETVKKIKNANNEIDRLEKENQTIKGQITKDEEEKVLLENQSHPVKELSNTLQRHLSRILERMYEKDNALVIQIKKLIGFFDEPDATNLGPKISLAILESSILVDETGVLISSFLSSLRTTQSAVIENKLANESLKDLMTKVIESAASAKITSETTSATVDSNSFGGFHSVGIYKINPADPAYKKILTARTIKLSEEPITGPSTQGLGDLSVMIVQEKPGQFRLYQISNDPTQLLKNVALLVNKATAAAAKYFSGGLAP